MIVLEDLEDFEVIDVIETVVGLLDQLGEDNHVLVPLEGLPQSRKFYLWGRKRVARPIGTDKVCFEANFERFVEEAIHIII